MGSFSEQRLVNKPIDYPAPASVTAQFGDFTHERKFELGAEYFKTLLRIQNNPCSFCLRNESYSLVIVEDETVFANFQRCSIFFFCSLLVIKPFDIFNKVSVL